MLKPENYCLAKYYVSTVLSEDPIFAELELWTAPSHNWDGVVHYGNITLGFWCSGVPGVCMKTPAKFAWHAEIDGMQIAKGRKSIPELLKAKHRKSHIRHWILSIIETLDVIQHSTKNSTKKLPQDILDMFPEQRLDKKHFADWKHAELNNGKSFLIAYSGTWTWVFFQEKPSQDIVDRLKEIGFRYSKAARGLYAQKIFDLQYVHNNMMNGGA